MHHGRLIHKLQRYTRRCGVHAAAQTLRRQGISLETALLLLSPEMTIYKTRRPGGVGLPGNGMSYTEQHRGGGGEVGWILLLLVVVAVLAFVFAA
jgi:hypothetical protein